LPTSHLGKSTKTMKKNQVVIIKHNYRA